MSQSARRSGRSQGDWLERIIRQALEQRIAEHQPPDYGRQALLARVQGGARSTTAFEGRAQGLGLLADERGFYSAIGYFGRDSHLSLAINSFTSPLLALMR